MSALHFYVTKQGCPQLYNPLECRPSRIKEIADIFTAEINDRQKISKTLNKYITALDYADKTLLVLSGAGSGVSLFSFTTVIGTRVRIVSASISFLVTNGIVKYPKL